MCLIILICQRSLGLGNGRGLSTKYPPIVFVVELQKSRFDLAVYCIDGDVYV
jgi:hypothetical protein